MVPTAFWSWRGQTRSDRARLQELRVERATLQQQHEEFMEQLDAVGRGVLICGGDPEQFFEGRTPVEREEERNHYLQCSIEQLQELLEEAADDDDDDGDVE